VRAQSRERMRRFGFILSALAPDDPESQARITAVAQKLQELGWTDGRNIRIDYRWGLRDADRLRRYAAELVAPVGDRDGDEIEGGITAFVRGRTDGMIVTSLGLTPAQRDLVIALAARHRLPTIYPFRWFVADGGLMSFGVDRVEAYRLAAGYVDRILRGEKPGDLPVQAPTKYGLWSISRPQSR
jgi:hypothetical protein